MPTSRAQARIIGLCALLLSVSCWADSLGSQSSVQLSSEYSSNPLYSTPAHSAESAAVQLNLPVTYSGSEQTIDLIPRLRFADTRGPAELLSNYEYFDGDWSLATERNLFAVNGGWHHDSTLYNVFEDDALQGHVVRRQEDTGAASWQHSFNELDSATVSGSWDRVQYGQAAGADLTSFNYGQVAASYQRLLNDRWSLTSSVGAGRYQVIGGGYRSEQWFAQVGAKRALSEEWTASLQAGYSHLHDDESQVEYYCSVSFIYCYLGFYPYSSEVVTFRSSKGAPNGSLTFERQFERHVLDLSVSRVIQPSGFGILATQDDASVRDTYKVSERWSLSGTLHTSRVSDALGQRALNGDRYYDADLNLSWQWTEKWYLQFATSYNLNQYENQDGRLRRANVAASLSLIRQFDRLNL